MQRASLVCALLNLFNMDDKEFTNNPPQVLFVKSLIKERLTLLKNITRIK